MVNFNYVWLSSDIYSGSYITRSVRILPVWVWISNHSEFNNHSGILLLRFGFLDRIQIWVQVSDIMLTLINCMNMKSY